MQTSRKQKDLAVVVSHKKSALELSKSSFRVESMDLPKCLSDQIIIANADYDRREDKKRNFSLRIGVIESYDNARDLFELATGLNIPEAIWLRTYSDAGNLVTAREFTGLVLRGSSVGYARMGSKRECPVCFINFEAELSNYTFNQVEV